MPRLRYATSPDWVTAVLADWDAFLLDHASCERKASATALQFVSHYPDRLELVAAMIEMAREELEHFQQVYGLIAARGIILGPDSRDPYIRELMKLTRDGTEPYFLDRLLLAGIIEARGCERFGLLAASLPPGPDKTFYTAITQGEARHQALFFRLAKVYFDPAEVNARTEELLEIEGTIVRELPIRPALH